MRILWLSPTPSKYKKEKNAYGGGGWIESLQSLLERSASIEMLGIAFLHPRDSVKMVEDKVTYYPIKHNKPKNIVSRIISNWNDFSDYSENLKHIKSIFEDFNPDVIHIFGTESWLCQATVMTNIPCVVHIQGILMPIQNAYNSACISQFKLMRLNWKEFIKGTSIWHTKRSLEKKSIQEYLIFKDISHFMGRTNWDRSISRFLSPKSSYFHVDEVLRDPFYNAPQWEYIKRNKIIITSTLSDSIYKGLDVVIKTASLLVKESVDFEWRIIGIRNDSNSTILFKQILHIDYSSINIVISGIKSAEEIVGLLSETTLYVHTSYIDNSPNSLCEAQLLGVPVIANNVGGISSLIDDGKDGFLVTPNDPYFLASRIVELSNNELHLKIISEQAKEKSRKRHSKENISNQIINTYSYLASMKSLKN